MAKGVNPGKDWCEMSKIVAHERYCKQFGMSVIFVWYAVRFIFLTSPNDCKLFHLRDLNGFVWQKSHSTKTPSTSRARKMQDRIGIKTCFIFICEVILCS